eukprot:jgi/Bigna1/85012/estExt_fgenesh1_pg.C_10603
MDVDQLLAEVDGVLDEATGSGSSAIQKFSQPQPEPKTKTTKISTPITVATPERKKTGSEKPAMSPTTALGEIDELLNEIDSVDALHVTGNDKKKFSTSGSESSLSKKTKCNKVYLGPGNSSRTDGRKLCTRMRCTSCDFEVLRFDNSKWNDKEMQLIAANAHGFRWKKCLLWMIQASLASSDGLVPAEQQQSVNFITQLVEKALNTITSAFQKRPALRVPTVMADCNVDEVLAAVGPEFTRAKAIRALKEADGDVEEAVAWLLEQDSSSSSSSEDMTIERENINQSETERPGTPKKADAKNAILKGREGTMTKMHLETKANLEHSQEGQKNKDAVLDGESSLSRKEFDQHHHRDDHSPKIAMQPVRSSKKLIAPVGIAKPSPMGILLGEDVDDLSVPSMSYPPSSSSYFPLEDFVALMEQSGVSVWPGTRMKTKGSSLSSSSFPPAAVVSALSRLYTYNMDSSSSSVEVGIRRFDFSTPSPDDIARDKRRTRLDNAKTRVKSTRTKRGGISSLWRHREGSEVWREKCGKNLSVTGLRNLQGLGSTRIMI